MVVTKRCNSFEVQCTHTSFMDVYNRHMERLRYVCFGRKKTIHGMKDHGFFVLYKSTTDSKRCMDKLAEWFGQEVVLTPIFGSLRNDISYNQCEELYTKLGTEPSPGKRTDLSELTRALRKKETTLDEILEHYPYMYHLYGRTLDITVHQINAYKTRTEMTKGIWYYGPTHSGKSTKAFEHYDVQTHYKKNWDQVYWQGYTGQEVTIMDDFNHQISYQELLQLCDKFPHQVPIDCERTVPFVSKKLIVTSKVHPSIMFKESDQLLRRFEIRSCTPWGLPDVLPSLKSISETSVFPSLETVQSSSDSDIGFNDLLDKLLQ